MMAVPFATALVAIYLAWTERRWPAIAVTLLTIAVILVLFRLHATDVLDLDL